MKRRGEGEGKGGPRREGIRRRKGKDEVRKKGDAGTWEMLGRGKTSL